MPRTPTHTDVEFLRVPHLAGVELRYSCYRESVFRTHTHPAWSVGVIESGSTSFTLAGRSHYATAGQMVVIGPGRAHACNPTDGDSISYLMFYLSREWFAPAEPDHRFPSFAEPVITDAALARQWRAVYRQFVTNPNSADGAALLAAIRALVTGHAKGDTPAISVKEREGISAVKQIVR